MGRTVTSSPAGQVLVLDPPSQLTFHGPFTDVIKTVLRLSNPSERRVCFKIKSNVPRQYCVQPSIALVPPNQHVDVTVMLQPVSEGSRPDVDCPHKFIVETLFTPDGELASLERLFQQTNAAEIMHSRLTCVFDEPQKAIFNGPALEPVGVPRQHPEYTSKVTSSTTSSSTSSIGISTFLLLLVLIILVAAIVYKCLD